MQSPSVALITGGGGDLAAAMRQELIAAGWRVIAPPRPELDVTSAGNVSRFFADLPKVDLLINNAGTRCDALLLNQPEEDRDAVLDVCLRGAFLCCREAARLMLAHRAGHIINIGSWSGLHGVAGQTAYAAAKAGLIGLTKSLAAEFGPANVRVNCVLPGWLETKFTRGAPDTARRRALMAHVLGRFNTPQDTARFILFLHGLTAVSGQVFQLDSRCGMAADKHDSGDTYIR